MDVINNIELGNKIAALREAANETQDDIAKLLNYKSHQQVSYLETGQRQLNINQIVILAKHFNVSADYLLGLTDVATNDKDVQFVCNYTGLNNEVIKYFHNLLSVDCVFKNTYQHVFDEELTKELYISRFGKASYNLAIEATKKNVKEKKKIYNKLLTSNSFYSLSDYEQDIFYLSEELSLYLALFFNDLEFIENQPELKIYGSDENIVISVMKYLNEDQYAEYDNIKRNYHLLLFECQDTLTTYIKNSYSALDKFTNYEVSRNGISIGANFICFMLNVIEKALKSDNVLETLNKEIQKAHKSFTKSEIDFFKNIFEEVKQNGND